MQLKKEKEIEFNKRQKLLDDFPQILRSLEEASIPLQEYFDLSLTEDRSNM